PHRPVAEGAALVGPGALPVLRSEVRVRTARAQGSQACAPLAARAHAGRGAPADGRHAIPPPQVPYWFLDYRDFVDAVTYRVHMLRQTLSEAPAETEVGMAACGDCGYECSI